MVTKMLNLLAIVAVCCLLGCNKKQFLDDKPRSDLFVPSTLDDFQALLDNDQVMSGTPVLGELSAGNYYINDGYWQLLTKKEKNGYIWLPDVYEGQSPVGDWNVPYQQVFYANVVLGGLPKIAVTGDNAARWNAI